MPDPTATVKLLTREIGKNALHVAKASDPAQLARLEDVLRGWLLGLEERSADLGCLAPPPALTSETHPCTAVPPVVL